MPNVTEATAEVGQMILSALQNTLGLGPDAAIAQAKAETGVTDETLESADMGEVFNYLCEQPGLSPDMQSFLNTANSNYNNYGNVSQSGSSYSGGGSGGGYGGGGGGGGGGYGGGGGGGGAAGGGANAQIVQQVTQNYNYQEINDNHIDILGPVNGDIDIDQDNDDIDVTGDGNAVNSGDGDQNAATGAGSSAAQSESGDAQSNSGDGSSVVQSENGDVVSNSGDGAVTAGDDVDLENSAVGDGNTIIDNEDGNFASGGSNILDNEDGTIEDSSLGFGEGNVQGDVFNEEGAANSQGGNATGQSVDTNVQSNVDEEHGPGDQDDNPFDGPKSLPAQADDGLDRTSDGGDSGRDGGGFNDNLSPQVEVNVEGGEGDQRVEDDSLDS
jgi:hypothetical protein